MEEYMLDSLDFAIYVTSDFVVDNGGPSSQSTWFNNEDYFDETDGWISLSTGNTYDSDWYNGEWGSSYYYAAKYDESSANNIKGVFADGRSVHTLSDKEILLSVEEISSILVCRYDYYWNQANNNDALDDFTQTDFYKDYTSGYTTDDGEHVFGIEGTINMYKNGYYDDYEPTDEEMSEIEGLISSWITKYITDDDILVNIYQMSEDYSGYNKAGQFKVAGFFWCDEMQNSGTPGLYISDSDFNTTIRMFSHTETTSTYERPEDAVYKLMIIPIQHDQSWVKSTLNKLYTETSDTLYYTMDNYLYSDILYANSMVSMLSLIFLVVGLVFAIFAALLLFNFISTSITNKKKEIGILRAVGAKSGDVFKIFFAESIIISLICVVISIIATAIITAFGNSLIYSLFYMTINFMVFTPLCILMMIGVAIIVALLGTFIPVYTTARKKPVDAIRSL